MSYRYNKYNNIRYLVWVIVLFSIFRLVQVALLIMILPTCVNGWHIANWPLIMVPLTNLFHHVPLRTRPTAILVCCRVSFYRYLIQSSRSDQPMTSIELVEFFDLICPDRIHAFFRTLTVATGRMMCVYVCVFVSVRLKERLPVLWCLALAVRESGRFKTDFSGHFDGISIIVIFVDVSFCASLCRQHDQSGMID